MLNRASSLLVESLEEAAASYGKNVATHPIKVTLTMMMMMMMMMINQGVVVLTNIILAKSK